MSLSFPYRLRAAQAFRSRPFTLLWVGQTISVLGDGAFLIALAWQVLLLTNSAAMVGLAAIAQFLPTIGFLLFGGVAADRLPQRLVMLVSDVGRAVLVVLVAVLVWLHLLTVWYLIALALCFGVIRGFFYPAYQALVPRLAEKEELPSANVMIALGRQSGLVIGPALGATLLAWSGPALVFAFDGLTFLISVCCLLALQVPLASQPLPAEAAPDAASAELVKQPARAWKILIDIREGWSYVLHTPWLWASIPIMAITNAGVGGAIEVGLPKLAYSVFHSGVWGLSMLQITEFGGMLLGTFLVGQLHLRRRGLVLYLLWGLTFLALLVEGLPLPPGTGLLIACLAIAGVGAGLGAFGVIWTIIMQELVPRDKLGRVNSIDLVGSLGFVPVGMGLFGVFSDHLGTRTVFLLAGVIGVVLSGAALCVRQIRELP